MLKSETAAYRKPGTDRDVTCPICYRVFRPSLNYQKHYYHMTVHALEMEREIGELKGGPTVEKHTKRARLKQYLENARSN